MKFFKFDERTNKLTLNREDLLLVECFERLFNKDKEKFWRYCKYLYLVYDNDSFLIKSKKKLEDRKVKSLEYVSLNQKDLTDELYLKCEAEFKYWNYTKTMELRDSNLKSIDKLDKYTSDIDLDERIKSGAKAGELVHSPSNIAKIRKDILGLVKDTKQLEQIIEIELEEKGRARGGKMSSPIETGLFDGFVKNVLKGEERDVVS